jgi:hypothetical protein
MGLEAAAQSGPGDLGAAMARAEIATKAMRSADFEANFSAYVGRLEADIRKPRSEAAVRLSLVGLEAEGREVLVERRPDLVVRLLEYFARGLTRGR